MNNNEIMNQQTKLPVNGMAIASFVLSLINILWAPSIYFLAINSSNADWTVIAMLLAGTPIVGLVLGIIGVVFAGVARKNPGLSGLRITGFVISLICLICAAITLVICLLIIAISGAVYTELVKSIFSLTISFI